MVLLVIVGILAIIAGLIWLSVYLERKRTDALRQACLRLGYSFFPRAEPGFQNELSRFSLFNHGHSRVLKNLMRGAGPDAEIAIFDYRYTVGSGKNQHTKKQTVVRLRSAKLNLPAFTLNPENIMHKIGAVFGYQDIDFAQHPGFSKRYLLRGQDESRIRMVFNDPLINFFEARNPIWLEGQGNDLICYRNAKEVKPENLNACLQEALEIFQAFCHA